mgnify:CR=1 FL=1
MVGFGRKALVAGVLAVAAWVGEVWAGQTAIAIKIPVTPELEALFQKKNVATTTSASVSPAPTLVVTWDGERSSVQGFTAQGERTRQWRSVELNRDGELHTVVSF